MLTLAHDVLYEDTHILVLNKPAGLLSQPSHDRTRAHVVGELSRALEERDGEPGYLAIHHRLDLPTSGVMVLARSKQANVPLMNAFKQRLAHKQYHALCVPSPYPLPDEITNHLAAKKVKGKKGPSPMVEVHAGGDYASTRVRVLASSAMITLIEASPSTGRRHQIRTHLNMLGVPILGDELYGGPLQHHGVQIERVMLHARRLRLPHPITGESLCFEADWPYDFLQVMERCGLARPEHDDV